MPVSGVSLVVIQFEMTGEFRPLDYLHYIAPKIQKTSTLVSTKKVENKTSKDTKESYNHRGWREFCDLTIETLTGDIKEYNEEKGTKASNSEFMHNSKAIIQLYKENQTTMLAEEAERSEMVCILAVPSEMTTSKLLHFTDSVCKDIENIRVIRKSCSDYYMALLKFRSQLAADEFFKNFNGVPFHSFSGLICHLVYVAKVDSFHESPYSCQPIQGHTELPTCPECLERMDESVEGILTVNTQGSNWRDPNCLVCRFCHTTDLEEPKHCLECDSKESLWICVICGHIGCGRYVEGHAYNHYLATEHCYAMQLGNNRVWDYAGDNYVHRLAQENSKAKNEPRRAGVEDEKLDSIQLEYTYLLTSQLETQRHFFENQLPQVMNENKRQLDEVKNKACSAIEERKQLESRLSKVTKEKQVQEKKINLLSTKYGKLLQELKDEKDRNKVLDQNQQASQHKLRCAEHHLMEHKNRNTEELHEIHLQLKDLMFYLEAKTKLQGMSETTQEEAQEGHISVGTGAIPKTKPQRRGKRH